MFLVGAFEKSVGRFFIRLRSTFFQLFNNKNLNHARSKYSRNVGTSSKQKTPRTSKTYQRSHFSTSIFFGTMRLFLKIFVFHQRVLPSILLQLPEKSPPSHKRPQLKATWVFHFKELYCLIASLGN